MELIKVRRNYQLTIPQSLREKMKLAVGDYVQADVEEGRIVIRPVEVVSPAAKQRQRSSKERQAAYALLDEIHRQMTNEDPGVIEETIEEAVQEVRR